MKIMFSFLAIQCAALAFSTSVSAQDATLDHGPRRVACDGQWDFHRPASEYPNFLRNCMTNNGSDFTDIPEGTFGTPAATTVLQQAMGSGPQKAAGREYPVSTGIDPAIEARAAYLYPFVSQQNERVKYIIDEMNTAADRQQGQSYSIHSR